MGTITMTLGKILRNSGRAMEHQKTVNPAMVPLFCTMAPLYGERMEAGMVKALTETGASVISIRSTRENRCLTALILTRIS